MQELELDYLEVKINEYCNLRCNVCANFSNIALKEEYGIKAFENDFKRLKEIKVSTKLLRLVGGEPLLCADLVEYIDISRRYNEKAEIIIVTNGTLIKKMPPEFFEALRRNDVSLHISEYLEPANLDAIDRGEKLLVSEGINYVRLIHDFFEIDYQFSENPDPIEEVSQKCSLKFHCYTLHYGRIYRCTKPVSLRHYDRKYNTNYADCDDGVNLYDEDTTPLKIFNYLTNPIKTCRYCTLFRGYVKWEQGGFNEKSWINTPDNPLLIENYTENNKFIATLENLELIVIRKAGNNKKITRMKFNDLMKQNAGIYLWCSDTFSVDRFLFVKKILIKSGREAKGYIITPRVLLNWLDQDTKQHISRKEDVFENKDDSLTIVFFDHQKLIPREVLKAVTE